MASKLFHAVVGVGISLGGVAACGGSTSQDGAAGELLDANLPDAVSPPPKLDSGPADTAPVEDAQPRVDAGTIDAAPVDAAPVDAAPIDAPLDVDKDAIVGAFCDAPWPITKSGREVCGPADDCVGQVIPWCYGPDGQGSCTLYPLECVGAEWQCMGGVTPTTDPGSVPECP
jgi:hypothetical protein